MISVLHPTRHNYFVLFYQRSGGAAYKACDYGSEFEYDSGIEKKAARRADLAVKEAPVRESKPSKIAYVEERSRDEARYMRHHYVSTNAVSFTIVRK